ncbi:MAG TPA: DUF4097 family beta strand repeat-containing protein [Polyangiaceae bacterium]|nr:DUF4097 family beta strand repeat-containing protein [Polyangiaceae bacterium]
MPRAVPIELRTGSGDVRMIEMRGNVNVETGSGDIDGTALEGADVSAHTGSGDVTLETLAAETIYVQTGSGDVKLWVPSGEYQLDVTSGSGDRTIRGVTDAARATSEIYVHTGSGDLVIQGR